MIWCIKTSYQQKAGIFKYTQHTRKTTQSVFEIAWWTGARDQQKQCRSSKAIMLVRKTSNKFCFLEIHIAQILLQTHFKDQNSLVS